MTPFTILRSPVLPVLEDRVDTDVIFPARFLLLMQRGEMGRYFFADQRFASDGTMIAQHPVNDPRYTGAKILVTGADFGCGSSREQAVWAMTSFGIRCVIAESFGEIFAANCAACHGENAKGMTDTGAPNLTDSYWTYGGDRASIRQSVYHGRTGTMPSWEGRLSPTDIKLLTLYVLDLRAGKP